ncbi:MAG: DUF2461 domain-containing protein [Actinomycetales bacterium]
MSEEAGAAGFMGFPPEAFEFYEQLTADNSKTWWQAHKDDYETYIRRPLLALTAQLTEFGTAHLFRPYRDVRFSQDKSPLKDHQGAFIGVEDGVGYYLQVSAAGVMVAGGWYSPQGEQLARFRALITSGHAGHVRGLIGTLERQGWTVDGQPLKTRPTGVDRDHPDLDLLRFRALTAAKHYVSESWLATPAALAGIRADWKQIEPLVEWLGDHVGPAQDPALEPRD